VKLIEAIIKPFKIDEVKRELNEMGIEGVTVSEVKGVGRQKGDAELCQDSQRMNDFIPKIKIEIVIADELAARVVDIIAAAARVGRTGDGKIFVMPMADAVRVRTGERGNNAI
jgi:nitrogen regulatory protein P-II 1